MDDQELKYWVGFSRLPGIGRARIALLEQTYGSLADAWSAPADALEKVLSLERRSRDALQRRRATIDLDRELDQLGKVGVKLITWHDDHYPRLLRETYDLPPLLYVRGTLNREDETSLAVVGTRKATAYGREATHTIVTGLVHSGVTIVSGAGPGSRCRSSPRGVGTWRPHSGHHGRRTGYGLSSGAPQPGAGDHEARRADQ